MKFQLCLSSLIGMIISSHSQVTWNDHTCEYQVGTLYTDRSNTRIGCSKIVSSTVNPVYLNAACSVDMIGTARTRGNPDYTRNQVGDRISVASLIGGPCYECIYGGVPVPSRCGSEPAFLNGYYVVRTYVNYAFESAFYIPPHLAYLYLQVEVVPATTAEPSAMPT